jgi:drug/metabolite transporter (DMT)-like permease
MNLVKAILLKVASAVVFTIMSAMVRWASEGLPLGQIVFFRGAFAILPVVLIYAWRGELHTAMRTGRPMGHVTRGLLGVLGMFLSFASLARLPLADVTAIGFAAPLITVALAAVILHERVRVYRWSAVAVGFVGVIVMLAPHLDVSRWTAGNAEQTLGAAFALANAFSSAASTIQTRRLTGSETNSAIVFYFSLITALFALLSWPLGWASLSLSQFTVLAMIGVLGGVAHLLMTESFRLAPASLVAPFDYTSILWAVLLGYFFFGDIPTPPIFIGAGIIIAAGLFVIWRERQLGLVRARPNVGGAPVTPEPTVKPKETVKTP